MPELQKNRDPHSFENSDHFWTGAECITEGCEEMAGTAWHHDYCWECNADRMDGTSNTIAEIRRKLESGELEEEGRAALAEENHIVDANKKVEEEKVDMAPKTNDHHKLINTLGTLGSDINDYTKLTDPDVEALGPKAALIDSIGLEKTWFPFSQLRVDHDGDIYLASWLHRKNQL